MNNKNIVLEANDLTTTFSRWGQTVKALDNINLSIYEGQWVMLVGHNGSGKSTLLKSFNKQVIPNKGNVCINKKNIKELSSSEISNYIFYVHQNPLFGTAPNLTLFENLIVADYFHQKENGNSLVKTHKLELKELKNKNIIEFIKIFLKSILNKPQPELIEKYKTLLAPLGLSERLNQLVAYLSGGERQLLTLLIANLRPSPLILLDEPFSALDPQKTALCLEQIKKLHQQGRTLLQVTHDPTLALYEGDRTILMSDGAILYDENSEKRNADILHNLWVKNIHKEVEL